MFDSSSMIDFINTRSALPYVQAMQAKHPLVHCLTNTVVQNFTANLLLTVGASPAMVIEAEEVADFIKVADAVLINIGTVTSFTAKSMLLAAKAANSSGTPWVFDPVAVGPFLPFRTEIAKQLLAFNPTAIRCNASEILVLDQKPSKSKGADSQDALDEAMLSADSVAVKFNTIVVLTGETDYITNGASRLFVTGGKVELTKVTGTGCGLSALVAAFIASHDDQLSAAASACALMAKASEKANLTSGLGSFAVSLIDNLSQPTRLF